MRLKQIDISEIVPNQDNPRGIDIQYDDEKLSYLKDSIKRFGVMVPIVVTPRRGKYFLIDGERRYWAAKAVGLSKLPAYVLTNDSGTGLPKKELLFRMFQIHHLREQWGAVQQCAALEAVYATIIADETLLDVHDPRTRFKRIVHELAEETGIDERTAFDRIKFLRWPDDLKQPLYDDATALGYSYILEIEDKIVIPVQTNYPEYFKRRDADDLRRDLFDKQERTVSHAQEVRVVAPYFRTKLTRPTERSALLAVLRKLQDTKGMTYEDARALLHSALPHVTERQPVSPRRLIGLMNALREELERFDSGSISKARARSRASAEEIDEAAEELVIDLEDFRTRLD